MFSLSCQETIEVMEEMGYKCDDNQKVSFHPKWHADGQILSEPHTSQKQDVPEGAESHDSMEKKEPQFMEKLQKAIAEAQLSKQNELVCQKKRTHVKSATESLDKLPRHTVGDRQQDDHKTPSPTSDVETAVSMATTAMACVAITECSPTSMSVPLDQEQALSEECRYRNCGEAQRCIKPREKCYMKATCSEKCLVTFHRSCWENIKGSTPMRNFFDNIRDCMTPDCFGSISVVKRYNLDGIVVDEWRSKEVEEKGKGKKKKKNILMETGRKLHGGHEENQEKKLPAGQKDQRKGEHRVSETINSQERETLSQYTGPPADGPASEQTSSPPSEEPSPYSGEMCPDGASFSSALTEIPSGASASIALIPPEVFLAVDEKDLVPLKKPYDQPMEDRSSKIKKNKKKKKRRDSQVANELQFRLFPDSYRRDTTNIPMDTASEAENQLTTLRDSTADQQSAAAVSSTPATDTEPLEIPADTSESPSIHADISESSSILLQIGLSQIEAYVSSQGGRVLMGQLLTEVDTWGEDIKEALQYPLIKRAVQLDEKQRISVFQKEGECYFIMNSGREMVDEVDKNEDEMAVDGFLDDKENEKCVFCMEDLSSQPQIHLPHCRHSFHRSCFAPYRGRNCPVCRTSLQEEFPALQ